MPILGPNADSPCKAARDRSYYHPSENPYAAIAIDDETDALTQSRPWHRKAPATPRYRQGELNFSENVTPAMAQSDRSRDFETAISSIGDYITLLQNPYASLSLLAQEDDPPSLIAQAELKLIEDVDSGTTPKSRAAHPRQGISKDGFRSGCRSIFLTYEPLSTATTRLRPEFAEFVAEHESKFPETRSAILEELSRYRITDNLQPHLNRERLEAVVEKLRAISTAFSK